MAALKAYPPEFPPGDIDDLIYGENDGLSSDR